MRVRNDNVTQAFKESANILTESMKRQSEYAISNMLTDRIYDDYVVATNSHLDSNAIYLDNYFAIKSTGNVADVIRSRYFNTNKAVPCYVINDKSVPLIKDVNIIVPEKVIEVVFENDRKEKMVLQEPDKFDITFCLFLALSKYMYKRELTIYGIEYKANELMLNKNAIKIVKGGLKIYNKKLAEEKANKEEEERIARKKAKRWAQKERRAERLAEKKEAERQKQIDDQAEAFYRAMKKINSEE